MGKSRGGRRQVLQLNDNKESYLARYGYSRLEEDDGRGDEDGSDEEPEQSCQSTPERLEVTEKKAGVPKTPDIDDKVANFLAEIDALDQNEIDAEEEEEEEEARPSFKQEVEIPPPTFQLNPNQQPENVKYDTEVEKPSFSRQSNKTASYRSMFVKGESEFTQKKDEVVLTKKQEEVVDWPDEPTTVWQQTLDDNTQCYYYWNTVTNEVTWEIPPEFTQYLLRYKDYEEKVEKLKKEGKVQPPSTKKSESVPQKSMPSSHVSISMINAKTELSPKPNPDNRVTSGGALAEGSVTSTSDSEPQPGILKNKTEVSSVLPDSTISKAKSSQPKLVAYFGGSSAESSTDSSEDSDSSDEDDKKKSVKVPRKSGAEQEVDDIDIDDIDKALEMALEKKTSDKDAPSKSKSSTKTAKGKKSEDKNPKSKSLVDVMRETVQKKQEVEARRKAAIEEMMARELERRVGPPRKRPTPEEPTLHSGWESKKPRVLEYEHGRKHRRSDEYEHSLSKSGHEKESRHKHEERKKHKKDDKDRDRKKDKEENKRRDDHGKRKDKHEEKHKDDRKKHKDKERDKDDKKKDKKKDRERDKDDSKKEKDSSGKREETKREEKRRQKEVEVVTVEPPIPDRKMDSEKIEDPKVEENSTCSSVVSKMQNNVKEDQKEEVEQNNVPNEESTLTPVQLANLKLEASELAELALSKLEFLEVTKKGLSKLQILLIELETRQHDWQSGGLKTEFFLTKLEEANWQLQQYEQSAAPPGWTCHWDRAYRRYFYMNKKSGRTQWDYPDEEEEEEEVEEDCQEVEMDIDQERSLSVSPDKETVEIAHPEPPTLPLVESRNVKRESKESSGETSQPGNSLESEVVSSTTVSTAVVDKSLADTTSVISASHPARDEKYQVSSDVGSAIQKAPPLPPTEPVTQSSYDYNGTAAVSVLRGEPPPPGTDLDLLLAAPPPPPPMMDVEMGDQVGSVRGNLYESQEVEPHIRHQIIDPKLIGIQYDHHGGVAPTAEQSGFPVNESESAGTDVNVVQTDDFVNSGGEPAVIARPPQVISREAQMFGEVVTTYPSDSSVQPVEQIVAPPESFIASSSDQSYSTSTDKKKKKKDKSISSSSLTLKKKNVSSLVQKWQKVKKEVEIEERFREEREMAIRQKLEEWKQEHS